MKVFKTGVIGFAHMHINGLLDYFSQLDNIKWVACADTKPQKESLSSEPATRTANLERAVEKTGIPKVYDDYKEMLNQEEFDIIIFCPENARKAEIVQAAAEQKIHLFTEKPLAHDLSSALKIKRAVEFNDISLMVNWPTTWSPPIRKAYSLIQNEEIGQVWEIKWRNGASMGPLAYGQDITEKEKGAEWWHQSDTGGGALLDYCCYGACLARWFLGQQAETARGIKANFQSHYGDAEDNAVITVRFPESMAILEGTWTTFNSGVPGGPLIYGTQGTIVVDGDKVLLYKERNRSEPTAEFSGELPEGRDNPAREFIHHLTTGDDLHPTLDLPVNIDAMAILDAGIRSAESGQREVVNSKYWSIG